MNLPVYRTKPLPNGDIHGNFLIVDSIISATRNALVNFALAGIYDSGHEGLVFWAGREMDNITIFTTAITPNCRHKANGVFINEHDVGVAARSARENSLALLCQVHSHPGQDARHSDGDDRLITMPFNGMLSIVVPNYGIGFKSIFDIQIHQFQEGQWVLCSQKSIQARIKVLPIEVDVR